MSVQLYKLLNQTPLCTKVFSLCNYTFIDLIYNSHNMSRRDNFNWDIEQILHELKKVINRPEMDQKSVLLLNYGANFITSTNFLKFQELINRTIGVLQERTLGEKGKLKMKFQGKVIWITIAEMQKGRHGESTRILTYQVGNTIRWCLFSFSISFSI